jgi:hypothetical protein
MSPERQEQNAKHDPGLSLVIPGVQRRGRLPATLAALAAAPAGPAGGWRQHGHRRQAAGRHRAVVAPRAGTQLAATDRRARGPWLLLLHADTALAPGWHGRGAGGDARSRPGLAFSLRAGRPAPAARRLERAVAWRCRRLGLPYGDQGLLIHRDLLDGVGGLRPLPLMEDVDLVRRLGRARLGLLPVAAVTSAARWRRDGYTARSARNLACLALWFAGIPPRIISRIYAGRGGG